MRLNWRKPPGRTRQAGSIPTTNNLEGTSKAIKEQSGAVYSVREYGALVQSMLIRLLAQLSRFASRSQRPSRQKRAGGAKWQQTNASEALQP